MEQAATLMEETKTLNRQSAHFIAHNPLSFLSHYYYSKSSWISINFLPIYQL